jgi:hypothetical protein
MISDFSRHIAHYAPLLGIFVFSILGFLLFSYNRDFQIAIIGAASVSYVIWGVIHHLIHRDFHIQILFEYVVIAVFGFFVLWFLVVRA